MFDSRAYLASLEPPVFVAPNGRTYKGRILSEDEWSPFEAAIQEAAAGSSDGMVGWLRLRPVIFRLTKLMFPKPWWQFWRRSVAGWMRRLPIAGQARAAWSFMRPQARAVGMEMTPSPGMKRLLGLEAAKLVGSPTAG